MTTDAPNPTGRKAEQTRGFKEASRQFELLRDRWPQAFPAMARDVRPLASEARQALVDAFGWSSPYAHAVLMVWKMQPTYCRAVLAYRTRIKLDGSTSDEDIDDAARAMATRRLEEFAARRAAKAERNRLRAAAEASASTQAPEPAPEPMPMPMPMALSDEKPEPAAPPEPPKPRKLLVVGSAAMEAALKRRLASGAAATDILRTVSAPPSISRQEKRAR